MKNYNDDFESRMLSSIKPMNKKYFKDQSLESEAKFFDNLNDYINEYTSISDVSLVNYQNIFLSYFLFCILILVLFVINRFVKRFYSAFIVFKFMILSLILKSFEILRNSILKMKFTN